MAGADLYPDACANQDCYHGSGSFISVHLVAASVRHRNDVRGATLSFSYQFGNYPAIDYPRLLISDTQEQNHVFEDSEILAAYAINAAQFQSSMFFSPPAGRNLPSQPISYLRCAALLLDALAANKARLSSITQLLDVKLSPQFARKALADQAQAYRDIDDNSGAFMIIEQCPTSWAFYDRFWNQWQRQSGGGF